MGTHSPKAALEKKYPTYPCPFLKQAIKSLNESKHIEKIIPAIAIISPAFIVLPNSALMTLFMLFHLP